MMKVFFIAHGNPLIGMGHIMRSLSLADAFRERGYPVTFFSKYELGIAAIEKQGFEVCRIPDRTGNEKKEGFFYGNPEEALQDAEYVCTCLAEPASLLIADSYNVNEKFFTVLREKADYLAYIDDLNAFSYPVDFLINGSASAADMGYEKTQQSAKLLLGLRYNLIRKEFRNLPSRYVNEEIKDILLTTGNSDPCHMTERILNILAEENISKNVTFHVIIGSGFEPYALKNSDNWHNMQIHLYEKPAKMSEIMLKCDLAITAGGSTLYELAACGVPAVVFAYAENQIPQILAMEKEKILQYIGNYQKLNKKKMIDIIQNLQTDYEKRKKYVEKLQSLVDAKGALRIVTEMEKMMSHYKWHEAL